METIGQKSASLVLARLKRELPGQSLWFLGPSSTVLMLRSLTRSQRCIALESLLKDEPVDLGGMFFVPQMRRGAWNANRGSESVVEEMSKAD